MTCIVGIEDHENGVVWMGGDSAGVSGGAIRIRNDSKIFKNDDVLFGFTSSFRMGQLLKYNLKIPGRYPHQSDIEWLHGPFMDAIIKCLENNKFASVQNNTIRGGTFLVGYMGKLYRFESDFQIGIPSDGFDACGCGEDYALGAIEILMGYGIRKEDMVYKALETAAKYSTGVSGPFQIVSL